MAGLLTAFRITLLLVGGLAALILAYFVIGMAMFPFGPFGMVGFVFLLLAAYFLIGRWVLRRIVHA